MAKAPRPAVKCAAHLTDGSGRMCDAFAVVGATVCVKHGALAPQVAARAGIRAAVSAWGEGDSTLDPGETLLRLMTVAYERAEQHADALNEILAAQGWETAFVGDAYALDNVGRLNKVGEYARQLAVWENLERKQAGDLAVRAVTANLEARRVRATEQQVAMVIQAMQAALTEAGLGDRTGEVIGNVGRHLAAVTG